MVTLLQEMKEISEIYQWPLWKAHLLTANRKGTWSLSVTANWRLTFFYDKLTQELVDLQLEDYH